MPKQPYFESAVHHLLVQMKLLSDASQVADPASRATWEQFIRSCSFILRHPSTIRAEWKYPRKGTYTFSMNTIHYYTRGDTLQSRVLQEKKHIVFSEDAVKKANDANMRSIVCHMAKKAGVLTHAIVNVSHGEMTTTQNEDSLSERWAETVDPSSIDVVHTNTAVTSPELRAIHRAIPDVAGKSVLDVGCGLGEAGIYFATRGARVTLVDISSSMLEIARKVAKRYGVQVATVQASVEKLSLLGNKKFDIIYIGNVMHHVDLDAALTELTKHLKLKGTLVCWEPVAYNPCINIYRRIAHSVRSADEHPFGVGEVRKFTETFTRVRCEWFWLTTTVIFVLMFFSGRNPNKERYWKSVVYESNKWKYIYLPLEALDKLILRAFPFLGPLCWNVLLVCSYPKGKNYPMKFR